MKNEERDWLDILDTYDDTASDTLRAVIEPLPSWDQAGYSGNNTFHTSTLSKRTGRSLRADEPAREGTLISRDPDLLENNIPLERTRRANGDPRRKCVYYEEEERFWKERSESCRIQQNAVASSMYDISASDNDAGDRTRPRVKNHPGAPQNTVNVGQSSSFPVQNSGETPGSVKPAVFRRTPVSRCDTPEMKEPRRIVDSNSETGALQKAEECRTIGRGGESRDVEFLDPKRRPLSAGQVGDRVRCRQKSEERLCWSNCRCRCRGPQKGNVWRLHALRDVERVLGATLVASKGGGGSGNGGEIRDFFANADRLPNNQEAKRLDKKMNAVIATDDVEVFSSSMSPRRRPQCRGRKGGVFLGDKEICGDRAGSIERRGGYLQQRTAASDSASPAGQDGSFFEEGCEMNRDIDEEEGEACDNDNQEEEAALGRVGDLGRRIALRCLHMEQECMRRERTQARLFEEQLRGARLAAQETTQRAIRAERSRAQKLLVEAQNKHDGREKSLVEQIKHEEEKWEKERNGLSAAAAVAKTELDRTKRLSREITECLKRDGEKSLEKQRMELHKSWVVEKGGWRKATEEAVRRAVETKTRSREEAWRQAQELRNSLEAQVRSWKGKAEASEKRALEEKSKRQALETKANNERSKEMAKAREAHEAILLDMTSTMENEREAHAREKENLQDKHRAHLLRVHQEKRGILEAERVKWQQEREETRAQTNARVEEALTHVTQEHTETLRRQRLAHDAEMRKAGQDILRLEREIRRLKDALAEVEMSMIRQEFGCWRPMFNGEKRWSIEACRRDYG